MCRAVRFGKAGTGRLFGGEIRSWSRSRAATHAESEIADLTGSPLQAPGIRPLTIGLVVSACAGALFEMEAAGAGEFAPRRGAANRMRISIRMAARHPVAFAGASVCMAAGAVISCSRRRMSHL